MGTVAAVVAILVVVGVWAIVSRRRHQLIKRVSARNFIRRKGSTVLVIVGSMVGTALIAGSLIIGDTSSRLYDDAAYRYLGEIDQTVSLPSPQSTESAYFGRRELADRLTVERLNARAREADGQALVDGAMFAVQEQAPVRKVDPTTGQVILVEPRVTVTAFDWSQLGVFGSQPPSLTRPGKGQVIVSPGLARNLELEPGDSIEIAEEGGAQRFVVRSVEDLRGMSGFWSIFLEVEGIPEAMLMLLEDGQAVFANGSDQVNAVFVSNTGGVTDGYQHSTAVGEAIAALLKDAGGAADFQIRPVKSEVLDQPFPIGDTFLTFSLFVVVAGVMLMLNIYAMLAEERHSEMGVMRALGMQRDHLVWMFLYEAVLYSLGAALLGLIVGLGLAWLVVLGINEFIVTGAASSEVRMVFTVEPASLLVAAIAGMAVTLLTVLYTSLRISRFNIVSAIRDLPEPSTVRRRGWTAVLPVLLVLFGIALTVWAITADDGFSYILGPTFAILGLAFLLHRRFHGRAVLSAAYLALIAFSQFAIFIPAVEEVNESGGATFVTGLILVLSAIGVVVLNLRVIIWLISQTLGRLHRILPVVKIAIAYPAERPTRTGFTLGMFAIVISFGTMASIYVGLMTSGVEQIQQGQVGGFDAIVAVDRADPGFDLEHLLRERAPEVIDEVKHLSAVRTVRAELAGFNQADYQSWGEALAADPEAPLSEKIAGLDEVFLRTNSSEFAVRSPEYSSDREVWEALASDSRLVVVGDPYSGAHWRLRRPVLEPGDTVRLGDPESGLSYEKKVIGRLVSSAVQGLDSLDGIITTRETLLKEFSLRGDAPAGRYLLRFQDDVDPKSLANSIEKELIQAGAQVYLVSDLVEQSMAWMNLIRILQAFLAFGLVVGIAGLAVVAARAVYQRRQDIGTLRALGFGKGMVLGYLLVESSLVSLLGIVLGVVVGAISGYGIYLTYIKDDIGGGFGLPVLELSVLAAGIYLAGLVFTFLPALRAASLVPAHALRTTE